MAKDREHRGDMTVEEAGHLGGIKGGPKGGQRVKELVEEGKEREEARADKGGPRTGGSDRH